MKTAIATGLLSLLMWSGSALADVQVSDSVVIYDGLSRSYYCAVKSTEGRFLIQKVSTVRRVGGGGDIKYELYSNKNLLAACDGLMRLN